MSNNIYNLSKLPSMPERILSALAYFTFGIVGLILIIASALLKTGLKPFVKFNVYQSVLLGFIFGFLQVTYDLIDGLFQLLQIIPFLGKLLYSLFQFIVIIGTIMMLNGYYFLYSNRSSDLDRMKMIYECLGAFLPIYSTINVAFLLKIEELLSSMYGILGVQQRSKIMAPILIISWMGFTFQVI